MSKYIFDFSSIDFTELLNDPLFCRLEQTLDRLCPDFDHNLPRNGIARWARLNYSKEVAIFFSFYLAKYLFANQLKWKLLVTNSHTVLVGTDYKGNSLIFDPITFVHKLDNISYDNDVEYVNENDICEWYNNDDVAINNDIEEILSY